MGIRVFHNIGESFKALFASEDKSTRKLKDFTSKTKNDKYKLEVEKVDKKITAIAKSRKTKAEMTMVIDNKKDSKSIKTKHLKNDSKEYKRMEAFIKSEIQKLASKK